MATNNPHDVDDHADNAPDNPSPQLKNQLPRTIPTQIGSLQQLTILYLMDNDLSGTIPSDLGELTLLKELGMSGNTQLTCFVPSQ